MDQMRAIEHGDSLTFASTPSLGAGAAADTVSKDAADRTAQMYEMVAAANQKQIQAESLLRMKSDDRFNALKKEFASLIANHADAERTHMGLVAELHAEAAKYR